MKVELKSEGNKILINHDGRRVGVIQRSFVEKLLSNDLEIKSVDLEPKEVKKVNPQMVKNFIAIYCKAKEKHYKSPIVTTISKNSKNYDCMKKAVEIYTQHNVSPSKFLKSQLEGLQFANFGSGTFPKPNQLCTEQAETRLLDYLKRDSIVESDIEIGVKEKLTPLSQNDKYKNVMKKIDLGTATLSEALYAEKCQLARRDKVSLEVEAYLEVMRENEPNEA